MERHTFEDAWPELERGLREALTRRRIPVDAREDILQDTALRLLRSWDRVRPESVWAFALTIALNIVRDEARKKERRDRTTMERPAAVCDPEHEALVRLELSRVRAALASMNDRQRSILLSEVGEATLVDVSTPALKMARMRARRRLRSLIEGASGYAAFSAGKLRRWIQEVDVGFANAAASIAVQVTAVLAVSGAVLPGAVSPLAGPSKSAASDPIVRVGTMPSDAAGETAEGAIAEREPLLRSRALGASTNPRDRSDDDLNEHFGVVHKDGDSIWIGDEPQVGPYGAHHTVAQAVGDSRIGGEVRARYRSSKCLKRFLANQHEPCASPGEAHGHASAALNEEEHSAGATTGTLN